MTAKAPPSSGLVLLATILGSSMAFIDASAVNVALPVMQRDLHATMTDIQWVVEAYSIFLAALILVGGALGDRFGRKLIFVVGVSIFTLSSIACGLAHGILAIAIARSVQGIGSALMAPASLAILSDCFQGDVRAKAIGTWSAATAVTAAVGPALGGWLVDHGGWQWIFFINVPIGAAVFLLTLISVPESRDTDDNSRLDIAGAALCTVGLGAIVYGLILAGTAGANMNFALAWSAAGLVAFIGFVFVEKYAHSPMMPLGLFASRLFSGTNLLTLLLYGALSEVLYFVSFAMIQVHGYTPTQAGLALLPFIALISLLSRFFGGLVAKYGARPLLVIGPATAGLGFALFALPGTGGSYWTTFFPACIVAGLGMSITVAPLTTTVMNSVDQKHLGTASGINNAVSRVGGLIAIAAMSAIVVATYVGQLDGRLSALEAPARVVDEVRAQSAAMAAAQIQPDADSGLRARIHDVMNDSFVFAFRVAALTGTALALGSALIAAVTIADATGEVKPRL